MGQGSILTSDVYSIKELEIEWLIIRWQLPFVLRHAFNLLAFLFWASVLLMGNSFIDWMECDLEGLNKIVNAFTFPFLNYKDLFFSKF